METWLNFAASIISSTVWPLCALGITFLFRKDIHTLLIRLNKISAPGVTADFSGEFAAIEDKLAAIDGDPAPTGDSPAASTKAPLVSLSGTIAETSPAAAVSYAWSKIELALREKMRHIDPNVNLTRINSITRQLHKKGKIKTETLEILTDLRKLHDELIRSEGPITFTIAMDYNDMAEKLLDIINAITE
jgi:hypothetical protein